MAWPIICRFVVEGRSHVVPHGRLFWREASWVSISLLGYSAFLPSCSSFCISSCIEALRAAGRHAAPCRIRFAPSAHPSLRPQHFCFETSQPALDPAGPRFKPLLHCTGFYRDRPMASRAAPVLRGGIMNFPCPDMTNSHRFTRDCPRSKRS
jgi:hypothetical protein